ncbi:hypothetical protein Nepgr_012885 [Nepenthes gracilis]|uniref:Gnk2-homologous domain-containing protein n=1 Tax=Nepenthes gracilis TaxID=150966 RepID=A0AAD3SI36_NEPGR|nr:hypothetical protein Nepgr_012885 [Nepenthes gracilis]
MSASIRNSPFLHLLCFSLLLRLAVGADPLYHICLSSGTYTPNTPYEMNLNKVKSSLSYKTPFSGFAMVSAGSIPDRVYGLAQCRGDATSQDCKTCVANASDEIKNLCPYNKGGIIWYDNCLLKYLDGDFFHQIDTENIFYLYNVKNITDPILFNKKTKELLNQLSQQASATWKLFAAGETKFEGSTKIYGMAQCTRDLSNTDCKTCLENAISQLPSCCDGKQGGRVVGGSCTVRFEIYPFISY